MRNFIVCTLILIIGIIGLGYAQESNSPPSDITRLKQPYVKLGAAGGNVLMKGVGKEAKVERLPENQLKKIASNLHRFFTHGALHPLDIQIMRKFNPKLKLTQYVNGSYTRKPGEFKYYEKENRSSILMFCVGKLSQDINKDINKFRLTAVPEKKGIRLKPSRTKEKVSKSNKDYVSWIRIDDEFMKAENVNSDLAEVTVSRGFDGTQKAAHKKGAVVLAPVYVGSFTKRRVGEFANYPDGPGNQIFYALRPDHPFVAETKAKDIIKIVQQDYDGAMLDIMSARFYHPCDAFGNKVIMPWNLEKGQYYTQIDHRRHQEKKIAHIIDYCKKVLGKKPYIIANGARSYFDERGGTHYYLEPTKIKPVPIDGLAGENMFSTSTAYPAKRWHKVKKWLIGVQIIAHASQNNLPVICVSKTGTLNRPEKIIGRYEQFALFDYASFLLGYEPSSKIEYATGVFAKRKRLDKKRFVEIGDYFFYDLGKPLSKVSYDQVEQLRLKGRQTFARKYSKCMVLVNPSDKPDKDIKLDKPYFDPESKKKITSLDMPAHTGKILLLNK